MTKAAHPRRFGDEGNFVSNTDSVLEEGETVWVTNTIKIKRKVSKPKTT